jgi:hypothetical protein
MRPADTVRGPGFVRLRRISRMSIRRRRLMPVYPSGGADIIDNIRYLQDLADEIDASPALHSGSRRQEKRANQ